MTAIGFVLLVVGYIGFGMAEESRAPDWLKLPFMLSVVLGIISVIAGVATFLWENMP